VSGRRATRIQPALKMTGRHTTHHLPALSGCPLRASRPTLLELKLRTTGHSLTRPGGRDRLFLLCAVRRNPTAFGSPREVESPAESSRTSSWLLGLEDGQQHRCSGDLTTTPFSTKRESATARVLAAGREVSKRRRRRSGSVDDRSKAEVAGTTVEHCRYGRHARVRRDSGAALLLGDRGARVAEMAVISWTRPETCKRRA
jgi:hypothetical protein